jgi:hypothetical protein
MTAGGQSDRRSFLYSWFKAEGQFVLLLFKDREEYCDLEGNIVKQSAVSPREGF